MIIRENKRHDHNVKSDQRKNKINMQVINIFLDAPSHLYTRVCPFVRPFIRPSVRRSGTPSRRILCRVFGLVFFSHWQWPSMENSVTFTHWKPTSSHVNCFFGGITVRLHYYISLLLRSSHGHRWINGCSMMALYISIMHDCLCIKPATVILTIRIIAVNKNSPGRKDQPSKIVSYDKKFLRW